MKFHVGDTVKIKEGLNYENTQGFFDNMKEYCGKTAKIVEIDSECYKLDIDKGEWYWIDDMIEPVQKEYRIIVNGNTITVKDDNGNEGKLEGESDLTIGIFLALKNMRWKPKKSESYYTVAFTYEFNIVRSIWYNNKTDNILYNKGLVFKTKKEAIDVAQKMLEAIER